VIWVRFLCVFGGEINSWVVGSRLKKSFVVGKGNGMEISTPAIDFLAKPTAPLRFPKACFEILSVYSKRGKVKGVCCVLCV
jgi:hypothetical protein